MLGVIDGDVNDADSLAPFAALLGRLAAGTAEQPLERARREQVVVGAD
jgi:hypothetical protein